MRILVSLIVFAALAAVACGSDGATKYRVTVSFNETVTQADMDSVGDYLRGFDDGLDFLVQESFPPTGVATLSTDTDDFCATVVTDLESRPYVRSVDCREADDTPVESPDAPTSSEPAATPT
jgi:hypothetical protein